jgi:hypothetical protein
LHDVAFAKWTSVSDLLRVAKRTKDKDAREKRTKKSDEQSNENDAGEEETESPVGK